MFTCIQFFACTASAQVNYHFTKDTVVVKAGETFSNFLTVINSYNESILLKQEQNLKDLPKGLINLPDTLVLKAGESRTFPLKYIADRQLIRGNIQEFKVNLVAVKPGLFVQQSARFTSITSDITELTINTEEDEIYLSQLTNQAQVVVHITNKGILPLTFRILLTGIPDGLDFTGPLTTITLQPGAQQLLPFLARNKFANPGLDYTVTMQAIDESNHQMAHKVIRIINVSSARRMSGGDCQIGSNLQNTFSLHYASLNRNSSYEQLQANGKVNTGKLSSLDYRLNMDDYHQPGANGFNLYNSYMDYQAKNWGLKLGSIYDNLDFQLAGNGVKASAKLSDKSVISIYGIQNDYFLYNQLNNSVKGGRIYALDYSLESGMKLRKITVLHSRNLLTGLDADQVSTKSEFKLGKDETIGFEAGYSQERQIIGDSSARNGFSGGINYSLHAGDYKFYGNGYYSSAYFTGIRRGLLLTELRIVRKLDDIQSFSLHVNIQDNNPKYHDKLNNIFMLGINKNAIGIYELGYNTRFGKAYLNLDPYFVGQHLVSNGFSQLFPMGTDWKSSSFRFSVNLGYNGTNKSFSVIADYGYTFLSTSAQPPAPFHSVKISSSYTIPVLGFTSFIQLNPFYLSDALSSTGNAHYKLYSFGPNLHFNSFKNSLNVQLGGMYNYYGFTGSNNYSATGNLRYSMKGHWAITGDFQYNFIHQKVIPLLYNQALNLPITSLENQSDHNRQIRVGIEKQFGRQGNSGAKKLTLVYYQDKNSNGQRDLGEDAVAGMLVKINDNTALTNSKGEVVFTDMKKEGYTVTVTNSKGWSLHEPTAVFLDKNKRIEVGLVQTQALNGCLKPVTSKYMDEKPVLAGIRVNAVDDNGHIYQTLTDDNGVFCFYLSRNKYTVYIETEGMPFSIENNKKDVFLNGHSLDKLVFLYRDQHRKIGITHFN